MGNREIKFRAWDEHQKKMYYFNGVENCLTFESQGGSGTWSQFSREEGTAFSDTDSLNAILMQYTGLKDKNGKEIYEGDILYWDDFADDEYWAKYKVVIPDIFYTLEHLADFKTDEDVEIIGNIYENPELIKQPNEA